MNEKTAFPLCWPPGWPKTEPLRRETAKFKQTLPGALANLQRQIALMGGTGTLLSSNYTLGAANPKDPGVVAYFTWNKLDMATPCDRWNRIEANVQAIALTVEAMRGMERWGAKHMIRAMFTGFKQLPETTSGPSWWTVLGVPVNAGRDVVAEAYRKLVKSTHPDAGGDQEKFIQVQRAWEEYERNVGQ